MNSQNNSIMENNIPVGFVTTKDLTDTTKVSQSILANQLALNYNESIKHTDKYRGNLKYRLKNAADELIKSEPNFDRMFDKHESGVVSVYDEMDGMIREIVKCGVHHSTNITDMLRAFQKDPASICGIVNKINRNQ